MEVKFNLKIWIDYFETRVGFLFAHVNFTYSEKATKV